MIGPRGPWAGRCCPDLSGNIGINDQHGPDPGSTLCRHAGQCQTLLKKASLRKCNLYSAKSNFLISEVIIIKVYLIFQSLCHEYVFLELAWCFCRARYLQRTCCRYLDDNPLIINISELPIV